MKKLSALTLLTLIAGSAPGCVPTEFDDRRNEASTVSVAPPDTYPNTRFGTVVVGYSGLVAGTFGSRVGATAGRDTPFIVYPMLIGDDIRLDQPTMTGCDINGPCEVGAGNSLVGMPTFRGRSMCLATAAMETGQIKINCEDDSGRFELVAGPSGERFGFAGAGLRATHPFGSALYGAPGALGGGGAVYRLSDSGAPSPLDLSMGAGVGRELGSSVAIGIVDADTVLIAAGAPTGSEKRVILATVDIEAGGAGTTSVRGCIDATTRGFGQAIAIGDFNGDGAQDVAIGSGAGDGAELRDNTVHIYSGANMPPPGSCVGAWDQAAVLSCPTAEGITCDDAANFGAALGVGDINGDGVQDLIVGAPNANVDGTGGAGAVYVFAGVPGGGELRGLSTTVAALAHSSPSTNANLGVAVSSVASQADAMGRRRDEVIAGAPGSNRVYVFLCTGLDGDRTADHGGTRCLPLDT